MRSFDQGSIRASARKRCRRQRPEGRGAARRVILPPPPSLHKATHPIHLQCPISCPAGRMRSFDQGSIRASARKRCRRQRPEGRLRSSVSPDALRLSGLRHHYTGGKRRLTGELFTIEVLHCAYSARPSSNVSSCSIVRTTSRITKQSSPVTLSLSMHSGIAWI